MKPWAQGGEFGWVFDNEQDSFDIGDSDNVGIDGTEFLDDDNISDIQGFLSETRNLKTDIDALRKNGMSLDELLIHPGGEYSSALNSLYDKYQAFNVCNPANASGYYLAICRQIVLNQALAIENTRDVETRIGNALNDIAVLSARITDAKDSKESQDLANAVTARSVQLNVLTHQWEITIKQAGQRAALLEQQR